jgi:hypothetical protein
MQKVRTMSATQQDVRMLSGTQDVPPGPSHAVNRRQLEGMCDLQNGAADVGEFEFDVAKRVRQIITAVTTREQVYSDRIAVGVCNDGGPEVKAWEDGEDWWHILLPFFRVYESAVNTARRFHTFVDCWLGRLQSWEGEMFRSLQRHADGRIKMSAVIESFATANARVLQETLRCMRWAGHYNAFTSLTNMKDIVNVVTEVYLEMSNFDKTWDGATCMSDMQTGVEPWKQHTTRQSAHFLFRRHRRVYRAHVLHLKATGCFTRSKGLPTSKNDALHVMSVASCGSMSLLYGNILLKQKYLQHVRNTHPCNLRWKHFIFVPTFVYVKGKDGERERKARFLI